jgi:hypothetical protein
MLNDGGISSIICVSVWYYHKWSSKNLAIGVAKKCHYILPLFYALSVVKKI